MYSKHIRVPHQNFEKNLDINIGKNILFPKM